MIHKNYLLGKLSENLNSIQFKDEGSLDQLAFGFCMSKAAFQ